MAGNSSDGIKVVTGKGSTNTKPVSGIGTDEGQVMLVNDVGRAEFAAPHFPLLTINAATSNLLAAIRDAIATTDTNEARARWGMTDNNDMPNDFSAKRGFLFKADATNSGTIFVGTTLVDADGTNVISGMPLAASESLFVEVTRASTFNFNATASSQKLYFLAF
tara:strand:- start:994 stop:1485 length:492 start_codon:yes stop_codon:yes gene_type:complete